MKYKPHTPFFDNWAGQLNYLALSGLYAQTKFNYVEASFGYFTPIQENLVFELYPGIGVGNARNEILLIDTFHNYTNTSFTKLFLQPSIGYKLNKFEVAFSARATYLNFYIIEHDIPLDKLELVGLHQLEKEYFNFEPAVSLGWRFNNTKFEMQWYKTTPVDTKILSSFDSGFILTLSFLLKKNEPLTISSN